MDRDSPSDLFRVDRELRVPSSTADALHARAVTLDAPLFGSNTNESALRAARHHTETILLLAVIGVTLGAISLFQAIRHQSASRFILGRCHFSAEVEFVPSACEKRISHGDVETWHSYVAPRGRVAWWVSNNNDQPLESFPQRVATSRCPLVAGMDVGINILGHVREPGTTECECLRCMTEWRIGKVHHSEGYHGTRFHELPSVTGCECNQQCFNKSQSLLERDGIQVHRLAGGDEEIHVWPGSTVRCYYDGTHPDADVWFVRPRPLIWLLMALVLLLPSLTWMIALFCRQKVEEVILTFLAEVRGWARMRD